MFSSAKNDWRTPRALFDQLNAEFNFNLDAAASQANALCGNYYALDHPNPASRDGLKGKWGIGGGATFCNPPYGHEIGKWVQKAAYEVDEWRNTSVLLVPARTDTKWWKLWVATSADEVRFIEGRVNFEMPISEELRLHCQDANELGFTPKDMAASLGVPLVAVRAALEGKEVATEAAPFPSALCIYRGNKGPYRWWKV